MFDASKLINEVLGAQGNAMGSARGGSGDMVQKGKDYLSQNAGGIGGGAIAGGLAGYMMGSKKGRKMAKKAATYGGLALVAGLAYKAYSDYQQNKSDAAATDGGASSPSSSDGPATGTPSVPQIAHVPSVPAGSGFEVAPTSEEATGFGATLVSAMIAAAKADGQIDGAEHKAIFDKIEELELSGEEKVFLFDQLNKPLDIDSLVAKVGNPGTGRRNLSRFAHGHRTRHPVRASLPDHARFPPWAGTGTDQPHPPNRAGSGGVRDRPDTGMEPAHLSKLTHKTTASSLLVDTQQWPMALS